MRSIIKCSIKIRCIGDGLRLVGIGDGNDVMVKLKKAKINIDFLLCFCLVLQKSLTSQ